MRQLSTSIGLIFQFLLFLCACATQNSNETKNFDGQWAPPPGNSRPAGWVDGALAAWVLIHQNSGDSSKADKRSEVEGDCRVKADNPKVAYEPCTETYILFRDVRSASETRVWVDEGGRFSLPIAQDQVFSLEAVSERYDIQSNSLKVDHPAHVNLTIEPKETQGKDH